MNRLEGRVVAITRDGAPDDPLAARLRAEGATVRAWPTLSFAPPADPAPLGRAVERLESYDWIVFTSARGADALTPLVSPPPSPRIAAVGAGTASALQAAGWPVQVTGDAGAVELVAAMAATVSLEGARVLFPAASRAARTLEDELVARGARVDRREAYHTVLTPPERARVLGDLEAGVDVVAFASPSAIRSLATALGEAWPEALARCGFAAIGETTARALVDAGVEGRRVEVAAPSTLPALVDACVRVSARAVETSGVRAPAVDGRLGGTERGRITGDSPSRPRSAPPASRNR